MREMDTESPVVWPAWCYSGWIFFCLFLEKSFKIIIVLLAGKRQREGFKGD